MAATAGLIGFGVLFFLTLGFLQGLVLFVGALFFFVLLHYVLWGWWLGRIIRQETAEEEAAPQPANGPDKPPT